MLRLSGGDERAGRVEVFMSGRWGSICNDGITDDVASLVCQLLGLGLVNNINRN